MASRESQIVRQYLQKAKERSQTGKETSIEQRRKEAERMLGGVPLDPDVKVEKLNVEGIPAEWVVAPDAVEEHVFLYLHGGAYILGSCETHRELAARLSRATATRVLVIEYRLAPEHPYPAAVEDAVTAYRWLLSTGVSPEQIVVGGDSAGGGLSMALLLSLKEAGEPLPSCAVLLSPWTDMEGTGESMKSRAHRDPWLEPQSVRATSTLYTQDLDPRHPLVSPIYGDLQGLPPLLVHVGEDEILLDDSVRLVERARDAGVDVTFKRWEEMWHVFQGFAAKVPEGRQSIAEIGEYVADKLSS
ncbi:Acetyl esterase/lipase [Melghirimyces thermohalophilus]|uniref:Acetyl esterase/lipase n=1 Tax=Melghirimyces thermohalophilus TaxID=1236220 RepID=A0A1G6N140_9BACL|nr:alpha/beta hydrolase [Melghirimyces thermohalophilus]SDC61184.1 Acetyl esterase/lipase [Melghirimyces thermohalophilus]